MLISFTSDTDFMDFAEFMDLRMPAGSEVIRDRDELTVSAKTHDMMDALEAGDYGDMRAVIQQSYAGTVESWDDD